MWRIWYLLGLNSISHFTSHRCNWSKSFWRSDASLGWFIVRCTAVSSANRRTCDCTLSGRSFMYNRNKIGLRTDPCGTPEETGITSEHSPSSTTDCVFPTKKDWIHERVLPWTICICNLWSNFRWFSLSKAFLKSSRIRSLCLPFVRDLVRSSTSWIIWISQNRRSRNPCCTSYSKLCFSRCLVRPDAMMCSKVLHKMHVSEIGR